MRPSALLPDRRLCRSCVVVPDGVRLSHFGRGRASATRHKNSCGAGIRHAYRFERHRTAFTQAVAREFAARTRFRIITTAGADADAVLHGIILKQT